MPWPKRSTTCFARLIPVDQEHNSGAEEFEHRIEQWRRLGRMGAGHQKGLQVDFLRVGLERSDLDL
jgi:hypothetical protein